MSSDLNNWAKKYEDLTNSDATIAAMAKYYSCSFMFDMEKAKVIIEMHDGKVKHINTNPGPLDPYDFALRASANTGKSLVNLFLNQCIMEYGLQVLEKILKLRETI